MISLLEIYKQSIVEGTYIGYHGTSAIFDKFDLRNMNDAEGKSLNLGWGRGVILFTTKYSEAMAYAKSFHGNGTTPRVIHAELTMNNPFRIGTYSDDDTGYARYQRVRDGYVDTVDRSIWWGKIPGNKNRRMEAFVKQLKKEGYDGIISGRPPDVEYVIFKPDQIQILDGDYKNE